MNVLIYDPLHSGHHLNYVRLLIEACAAKGHNVTFATSPLARTSDEYRQHLSGSQAPFSVDGHVETAKVKPGPFEGFGIARQAWLGLRGAIERNRPDYVLIPYADHLLRAPLSVWGREFDLGIAPDRIEALFLQGAVAYHRTFSWKRRLRAYLELWGLRRLPFGKLYFIDTIAVDWLRAHNRSLRDRCALIADPVGPIPEIGKLEARAQLGIPTGGRLISCVGVLDKRKGVDEFVSSFCAANLREDDRLLLAGKLSAEVTAAVDSLSTACKNRVIVKGGTLTTREFDLAIAAADLIGVTYRHPHHLGVASILVRAAWAGRPVLSSPDGWPGAMTPKYGLGWIYPKESSDRAAAIRSSLDASTFFEQTESVRQFRNSYLVADFCDTFTSSLGPKP